MTDIEHSIKHNVRADHVATTNEVDILLYCDPAVAESVARALEASSEFNEVHLLREQREGVPFTRNEGS